MEQIGMNWALVAAIIFAAIIFLIMLRIPISLVFMTIGVLGFAFLMPRNYLSQLGPSMWDMLDSFSLTAVVPFVLMGELLLHGGISKDMYTAMERWLGRLPGSLAQANIAACALFAAISGSSVSCAATMGTIAGPEMEDRGYDNRLTYGTLAAGGTLGILIPPSIPMILYGVMTQTSIGALFMSGMIPGLVCVFLFMAITAFWVKRNPKLVPTRIRYTRKQKFEALWGLLPTIILIIAVLGGIYTGIVTPTEAATVGAVVAAIILVARKRYSWEVAKKVTQSTITVSSMSYMILAGSALINFIFGYMEVPQQLSALLIGLGISKWLIYLAVIIMYIILGMFIDGISMMVLTVPTVVPLLTSVGFDPIWICVFIVILIELVFITPPVGVNLFILQGTSKKASFGQIVMGAIPYMGVLLFMLLLLALFPNMALWLPSTMNF
jgi:tripartite ATP-independent transporter DctM subunit